MKQQLLDLVKMEKAELQNYMERHGDTLFPYMLTHLGTIDSELRDQLIYQAFCKLITYDLLREEQLAQAFRLIISDEYLMRGIEDGESYDVFTRSFSTLWLTGLFWIDKQKPFLEQTMRNDAFKRCATYLLKEHDTRGFVEDKGWAHSIAHGADLAAMIVDHPDIEKKLIPVVLEGITSCFWKGRVYVDDEDERLVAVLMTLVTAEYEEEVLIEWVEQVFDRLEQKTRVDGYDRSFYHARTNSLQFMKTFYFALKKSHRTPNLRNTVAFFVERWQNA